jgi:hypothetical protein
MACCAGHAWLLARAGWPEHRRVGVVWLAVAGYALLAGVVVAESLAGVSPLQAGLISVLAHLYRPR